MIRGELFEYRDGQTVCEAFVAHLSSRSKQACVLIAHDWSGRLPHIDRMAEEMAAQGYVGVLRASVFLSGTSIEFEATCRAQIDAQREAERLCRASVPQPTVRTAIAPILEARGSQAAPLLAYCKQDCTCSSPA